MIALLLALTAQADDTLRATFERTPDGLRYVRGTLLEGAPKARPGALQVLDADGGVLATTALPPLASHRAVITPEGHDVGHVEQRFVRLDLPWSAEASKLQLGRTTIEPVSIPRPPPGDPPVAVLDSGPTSERLDLVILAEGYQTADEALFERHVDFIVDHLSQLEPYDRYIGLINIWRAFTVSNDAGIDDAEPAVGNTVDTEFECYRGCADIDRLICCDEGHIVDVVDEIAPYADGILLLVNDSRYGGSGGEIYSTAYTGDSQALKVAAHELGHTLFLLWDEYTYSGLAAEGEYISPNCAPPDTTPPWEVWTTEPGVGSFTGCSFSDWVRPTQGNCMMNVLQDGYCPVCREHVVKQIYARLSGGMIATTSPEVGRVKLDGTQRFEATIVGPDTGLTSVWALNGETVATNTLSFEYEGCVEGDGELILTVRDETEFVRNDPEQLLTESVSWTLRGEPCEARACGCDSRGGIGWAALFLLLPFTRRRT